MGATALVAVGILAALILASPAVAQESDTTPPTLAGGERGNTTTIQVTVTDDTDVDEESIEAEDFSLSDGDVAGVQANESGSDANVDIYLDERLDTDNVTVEIASGRNVTDAAGNVLTDGSVTVTGMDSYLPQLRDYSVERINATSARIVVRTSEPLAGLGVEIRGPSDANLTRADFRAVDDNTYGIPHVTTYEFPVDGVYQVSLVSLMDEADHFVNYSRDRTFVRDASTPTANLRGPGHLETGDLGRFNGSASTDNVGIARYEWTVDGADAGNGSVFEHAFDEPGTHEVGLTVADDRGNQATANWSVVVHEAPSKEGVTVTTTNGSGRIFVAGTDRTNERVRVTDDYGRLAGDDDVTVRSVTITLPTNESRRLNVSGNATAPSFTDATGNEALTVVSIDHGNQRVEDPTFRFSVSASRLSRAGISYSDVTLYRHDGNWNELPTDVVRATKSSVVYEATAPGLSTFVVGASGAEKGWDASSDGTDGASDGAKIRVREATLVDESVAFGEYAVGEATLVDEGDESATFVAGLTVGPDVVLTRPVTIAAGGRQEIQFATRATRNGTVAVNGSIAGDLTVTGLNATTAERTATEAAGNGSDGGGVSDIGASGDVDIPIPNPLALWPDGLVGAVLTGVIGIVVGTYAVLKALAIYLGY